MPSTSDRPQSKGRCARRCAWLILGACLALSAVRFEREVHQTMMRCCYDFWIFWEAADRYVRTHELYTDDLREYAPGTTVYKFPPLALAPLVLAVHLGIGDQVYGFHMGLQVAVYLGSALLLLLTLECARAWPRVGLVLILALNFGPFYETVIGLQVETWSLFLLVLALLFLSRGMERSAGATLAIAAMLKVYPALMLAYLLEIHGAWSRLPLNATVRDAWWALRGMCPWLIWLALLWQAVRQERAAPQTQSNASHA